MAIEYVRCKRRVENGQEGIYAQSRQIIRVVACGSEPNESGECIFDENKKNSSGSL